MLDEVRHARARFPRRSVVGADGSSRPGAKQTLFRDHYLDVPFDLSKVLSSPRRTGWIPSPSRCGTAWKSSNCPVTRAKRNYTSRTSTLIPKQTAENGIKAGEQIEFTDEGLREIIHSFTREAGVRNLEREIATITRKQARRIAEGKMEKMVVTPEVVREFLGRAEIPHGEGSRGTRQEARRSRRTRLDAGGRRHHLHRGHAHAWRENSSP